MWSNTSFIWVIIEVIVCDGHLINTGAKQACLFFWSLSALLCNSNLTSFLFQSKTVKMSFLFDWIYRGFSSVLQFLGKYGMQFCNYLIIVYSIEAAIPPLLYQKVAHFEELYFSVLNYRHVGCIEMYVVQVGLNQNNLKS